MVPKSASRSVSASSRPLSRIGRRLAGALRRHAAPVVAAALAMTGPAPAQGTSPETATFAAPAVTIYPGDVIREDMVTEREFAQLRPIRGGYVASADALVGKVARRTLMPGFAVPQNAVENAKLVQKGAPTRLVFEEGGLSISALVAPLQAGELNESIKARNVDSGLIVYGIVQQDGTLRAAGGGR